MKNYNKLREFLSDIEHMQWWSWTEAITYELEKIHQAIVNEEYIEARRLITSRISRWKDNWKPYDKLSEQTKDSDREWADKILDSLPILCPIHQCGGIMTTKERKKPKDFIESEHYDGDEQTPDLICTNCKGIYQFKGFKK